MIIRYASIVILFNSFEEIVSDKSKLVPLVLKSDDEKFREEFTTAPVTLFLSLSFNFFFVSIHQNCSQTLINLLLKNNYMNIMHK